MAGFRETLDTIINLVMEKLRTETHHYSLLETGIDDGSFGDDSMPIWALKNCGALTILKVEGLKTIVSGNTYANSIIYRLSSNLSSLFKENGHYMQMVFEYDPERQEEILDNLYADMYNACDKLKLDLKYLVDSKKNALRNTGALADESNFICLWTFPSVLSSDELASETNERYEEFKDAALNFAGSANHFIAHNTLLAKHKAYVKTVLNELNEVGISSNIVNLRNAARIMQSSLDRKGSSKEWNVRLAGDYYVPVEKDNNGVYGGWNVLPENVAKQIFSQDIDSVKENSRIVKIGETYFAPVFMREPPSKPQFFSALFDKLIKHRDMGWRIVFGIGGNAIDVKKSQRAISAYLGFASKRNLMFNYTVESMAAYVDELGLTAVSFRMAACTWGYSLEKTENNVTKLLETLKSWGSPDVTDVTGNPVLGLSSATMGFTPLGIAPDSAPPFADALAMLPLSRPAPIWATGSEIATTLDGKPMPSQDMSSKQSAFTTVIVGRSGSGKSVHLNNNHISFVLTTENDSLPYIAIIDYDRSSEGFCDLMIEAVEPHLREQIKYIRLQNTRDFCINPLDTLENSRFLLPSQQNYAEAVILMGLTDPLSKTTPPIYSEFVGVAITRTMQAFSDCRETYTNAEPRAFDPMHKRAIRIINVLNEIGFTPLTAAKIAEMQEQGYEGNEVLLPTTWHEIADVLLQHPSGKYKREGRIARYLATPTLRDLLMVVKTDTHIQQMYGDAYLPTGEKMLDAFSRSLGAMLEKYPIIAGETQFELHDARIVALDVMDLVGGTSDSDTQKSAIAYTFAVNAMASSFMISPKSVINVPAPPNVRMPKYTNVEMCKQMFLDKYEALEQARKRFVMDEMSIPLKLEEMKKFTAQVVLTLRKKNTQSICVSQFLFHFTKDILSSGTTFKFLSSLDNEEIETAKKYLNINEQGELYVLQNDIRNRKSYVAIHRLDESSRHYAQLLTGNICPITLWSLTTTAEDFKLMKTLSAMLNGNSQLARKMLAIRFKKGSAKDEIKEIKRDLPPDSEQNAYDLVAKKVIKDCSRFFNE